MKGLFKISSDNENNNNYEEFYEEAKARNNVPGKLIGRYVASIFEGERYDFYEAWMELLCERN